MGETEKAARKRNKAERQQNRAERQQVREERRQKRADRRQEERREDREQRQPKRNVLLERVPAGGICAEVGVWKGDFSERILRIAQPQKLYLIDPWRFEPGEDYEDALYGGRLEAGQADMDVIHAGVAGRFAAEIAAGTVVIHRASSADIAHTFPDHTFDWVYIDGNHLYEFVKEDLELWSAKVKPGGILAGDDYQDAGWWAGGVKRAVDEFAANRGYEATVIGRQFMMAVS